MRLAPLAALLLSACGADAPAWEDLAPRQRSEFVAHERQGLDLLRVGQHEGARAEFERCLAIHERSAAVHGHLARLHASRDARAPALRHARRAFEIDPAHPGAGEQLFRLLLDEPDAAPGEALAAARAALADRPADVSLRALVLDWLDGLRGAPAPGFDVDAEFAAVLDAWPVGEPEDEALRARYRRPR